MSVVGNLETDLALLESIRRHLLEDWDPRIAGTPSFIPGSGPVYRRNSSFNRLYPCLTDNWGELPLKEDDSEDMVVIGVLRDAVHTGWSPESGSETGPDSPIPVLVKQEPLDCPVRATGVEAPTAAIVEATPAVAMAAPTRGKHYRVSEDDLGASLQPKFGTQLKMGPEFGSGRLRLLRMRPWIMTGPLSECGAPRRC